MTTSITSTLIALAALVGIQVSVSIIYEYAGASGRYSFSQASSLTISEFVKLVISLVLLATTSNLNGKPTSFAEEQKAMMSDVENNIHFRKFMEDYSSVEGADGWQGIVYGIKRRLRIREFWNVFAFIRAKATPKVVLPCAGLAALLTFNNHFAFWLFLLVDPGTISLMKSACTFISAGILYFFGRVTNRIQWTAIFIQAAGMIVSQYDPCKGGAVHSVSSYLLLFLSVSITALSGCLNDHINKTLGIPLHAINVYLYFFSFVLNLSYFFYVRSADPTSPAFFEGYDRIAMMVVLCNCVIGLVITAVYKYADAVIKTMAQTVSTGILIFLSALLFSTPLGFLQVCGVLVIFVTSYLYFVTSLSPLSDGIQLFFTRSHTPVPAQATSSGRAGFFSKYGVRTFFFSLAPAYFLVTFIWTSLPGAPGVMDVTRALLPPTDESEQVKGVNQSHEVDRLYHGPLPNMNDIRVIVHWKKTNYNPELWHWRELHRDFLPDTLHYGFQNPSAGELPDTINSDPFDGKPEGDASMFAYRSLIHALAYKPAGGQSGVLWMHSDILLNITRLATMDRGNMWFPEITVPLWRDANGKIDPNELNLDFLNACQSALSYTSEKQLHPFLENLRRISENGGRTPPTKLACDRIVHLAGKPEFFDGAVYIPKTAIVPALHILNAASSTNLTHATTISLLTQWLQTIHKAEKLTHFYKVNGDETLQLLEGAATTKLEAAIIGSIPWASEGGTKRAMKAFQQMRNNLKI
ncbi:hypothetical protein HDU97_008303 [Phlyctochytrium planicorne]|nr:hypothetical protein HDU97_008303 [Phlyctochytrium planicorne]